MLETTLTAELPDGSFQPCHSPSAVVKKYFKPGQEISACEFIRLSRLALQEATDLVAQKFEFADRSGSNSLADIERWAGALPPDTPITISHIS